MVLTLKDHLSSRRGLMSPASQYLPSTLSPHNTNDAAAAYGAGYNSSRMQKGGSAA